MTESGNEPTSSETPEPNLRAVYRRLFHELEFGCTRNAMMNYHQAETLEARGDTWTNVTTVCAALSASGLVAGLAQKGQVLASRLGLAGLVGLPISGALQLLGTSTSESIPSYYERARRHTRAAAGWMQIAETARTMQLQMKLDPTFDLEKVTQKYEELTLKKETVSKEVLIPRNTHRQFEGSAEAVFLAMARKRNTYLQFLELESKHSNSEAKIRNAEDIDI